MQPIKAFIVILCCACSLFSAAQDTLTVRPLTADSGKIKIDTPRIRHHNPKIATRRSLIIPGWGQAYNREYWKIPLVWGALGTTAGIWIYNNTWYHRLKFAYSLVVDTAIGRYNEIHPKLKNSQGQPLDAYSLQQYRNDFRRNRDYSLLWFAGAWLANVADATVFGHLKEFDVSDDLSLKLRPSLAPGTRSAGLSLALTVKDTKSRRVMEVR